MSQKEDIVFITVDCWRHDSLRDMGQLRSISSDWTEGSVICASPHTGGAFPAIFASTYYPFLYEDDGDIRDGFETLPSLLSDEGYSTGGFVASNPVVSRWEEHFDTWWNGGLPSSSGAHKDSERSKTDKAVDFLKFRSDTTAAETFRRAHEWRENESGPTFLWIHLMEPHAPYLPGFRSAADAGLVRSYLSLLLGAKHPDNRNFNGEFPGWAARHLKALYDRCIQGLDDTLAEWVPTFADDSWVVMMGDHGEEFDHGVLTHARLYDETVRVPFLSNRKIELPQSGLLRQIDFSPAVVERLDYSQPNEWRGESPTSEFQSQPMIGSLSRYNYYWLAARSEEWKIIKPFDEDTGFEEPEAYHLAEDPQENSPLEVADAPEQLRSELSAFIDETEIQEEISEARGFVGEVDADVEDRLERLGYT